MHWNSQSASCARRGGGLAGWLAAGWVWVVVVVVEHPASGKQAPDAPLARHPSQPPQPSNSVRPSQPPLLPPCASTIASLRSSWLCHMLPGSPQKKAQTVQACHTHHPSHPSPARAPTHQLLRHRRLLLAQVCEHRKVGAALDAVAGVPCALPVPHQHHARTTPEVRQRQRRLVLAVPQPAELVAARPHPPHNVLPALGGVGGVLRGRRASRARAPCTAGCCRALVRPAWGKESGCAHGDLQQQPVCSERRAESSLACPTRAPAAAPAGGVRAGWARRVPLADASQRSAAPSRRGRQPTSAVQANGVLHSLQWTRSLTGVATVPASYPSPICQVVSRG